MILQEALQFVHNSKHAQGIVSPTRILAPGLKQTAGAIARELKLPQNKKQGRSQIQRIGVIRAASIDSTSRTASSNDAGVTSADESYMERALELAYRAEGETYPNPIVGCVIVKDGQIVGEGYHPKAGLPHAEVYALRAAGQAATGATAYVTLEPCSHYGSTPPCCRALLAAGVKKVVVGVRDPNPLVDGGGVAFLRGNGVEVDVGCLEERCAQANEEFLKRIAGG